MSIRTSARATLLAIPLSLAIVACGGDGGGSEARPAASELAIKYRNELGMTPAQADCVAQVLVGSDLSDASLAGMFDADLTNSDNPFGDVELADDDREALAAVAEDFSACLGVAPSTPSTTTPGTSTPPTSTPPDPAPPGTDG